MATIATLNVLLTAGTAQFQKGMAKAQTALTTLGKSVTSTKALLGGLATGAAVVGFTRIVGGAMEAIEETGNLADAIGMPVEALSKLQHAAKMSGTDVETLGGSLEKFTKNVGEAAMGSGSAIDAFNTLGLSAKALADMSPDVAFGEVAESISKIQNPAQRASVAMDIFGKQGLKLVNLLALGKAGIAEMGAEAKRLHTALTGIDVEKIRAANDAIDRVKTVFQGFVQQVAIQLAPFIEHVANAFTKWATSGEGAAAKVSAAIGGVGDAIAATADGLQVLTSQLMSVQLAALKVHQFFVEMKKDEALNIAAGGPEQMKGHEDIIRKAKQLEEVVARVEKVVADSRAATSWGDSIREKMKGIQDAANAAAQAALNAKPPFASLIPPQVIDKLASLQIKLDDLKDTLGMTTNQANAWRIGLEVADDATKRWAMDTANAIDALERLHQNLTTLEGKGDIFTEFKTKMQGLREMLDANKLSADAFNASVGKLKDAFDNKLSDKAKQLFEETRTPMEKLQARLGEFQQLLKHRAIDWDTYTRAVSMAKNEYAEFLDTTKSGPEALEFGSAAAESAIAQSINSQRAAAIAANELPEMPEMPEMDELEQANEGVEQRLDRVIEELKRIEHNGGVVISGL